MVGFETPDRNQDILKTHESFTEFKEKTGLSISYAEHDRFKIITVFLQREPGPGKDFDVSRHLLPVEYTFSERAKAAEFYKKACEKLKECAESKDVAAKMTDYFENTAVQNYPINPESGKPFTQEEVDEIKRYLRSVGDNMRNLEMFIIGMKNALENLSDPQIGTQSMEDLKGTTYENYSREEVAKLFRFTVNLATEEADKLKETER